MRPVLLTSLAVFLLAWTPMPAQCTANGLNLDIIGERLGDPFSISLTGTGSVSGYLGIDMMPGLHALPPLGFVCLGLTPNLSLLPFTLSPSGEWGLQGIIPPVPALASFTAHMQALAIDGTTPSGLALSNNDIMALRPPRIYFIDPGQATPFGTTPGQFCVFDALLDGPTTGPIPAVHVIQDAVSIPHLGLIAFLLGNGSLLAIDIHTGVPQVNIPLPAGVVQRLGVDGDNVLIVYRGTPPSPFGAGTPGLVRSYELPSGNAGPVIQLTNTIPVAMNPSDIIVLPGTGIAYLKTGPMVTPIDLVNAQPLPHIDLGFTSGAIDEWLDTGSAIYCLFSGTPANPFGSPAVPPQINAIDPFTHTTFATAAIALPTPLVPVNKLRYGPGLGGPTLLAHVPGLGALLAMDPSSFAFTAPYSIGAGLTTFEPSNGGTEWLLLCGGCSPPELRRLDPITLAITTVAPLPAAFQPTLIPLRSSSLNKAYLIAGNDLVVPFATDPATAPVSFAQIPVADGALMYLVE